MNNLVYMLKNHFVVIVLGAIVLYWGLSQYKTSSEGMAIVNPKVKTVVIEGGMIPLMETHAVAVSAAVEVFLHGVAGAGDRAE